MLQHVKTLQQKHLSLPTSCSQGALAAHPPALQPDAATPNLPTQKDPKISTLLAEIQQLKSDKQDLVARLNQANSGGKEDGEDRLASLDTEVAQLKTDRQLLTAMLNNVEQLLAEARSAVHQKEGHLQGLQVHLYLGF